jgi:hypothetical protein
VLGLPVVRASTSLLPWGANTWFGGISKDGEFLIMLPPENVTTLVPSATIRGVAGVLCSFVQCTFMDWDRPNETDPLAEDVRTALKGAPKALRKGLDDLTLAALAGYVTARLRLIWRFEKRPQPPPHGTP